MSEKRNHFYKFGPFRFHPEEQALVRDGKPVSLPPRVTDTLFLLLQNAGHLVEKDRLIKVVWKDAIVEEGNLNKNIFILRKALGQTEGGQEYIETVPKRGYRFIGAVQTPETDKRTPDGTKVKPGRKKSLWVGVGAVVLLCLAVVVWRVRQRHSDSPLPPLEVLPFISLHGFQGYPAFSPDGNQVAFTRYDGEDAAIYTALIDGDTPLRLTTTPGVCCPTWFPDGRQIAYMGFSKNGLSIDVISALGGAEKTLYKSPFAEQAGFPGRMCDHMDFSPDGKWLAFGGAIDVGYERISLLSLDDLRVKPLTSPETPDYDCEPAFSPDGRSIAFERGSAAGMGRDLFVVPVTGGEARRLTVDNAWGGVPAWTPDGTEMIFPSSRGGLLNLWRIFANGGSPRPVAGIGPVAFAP
jgi:DNA-binding winged helix-turn-helix (wHTH) protein/Tol biopolymer transport system component